MRQSRRFSTALARTSAFPRTETHLLQQTVAGAALSVAGAALVLILLVCELRDFMRLSTELKLGVDTSRGQTALPMVLDISFPWVPCAVLTVEALDLAGTQESGQHQSLVKTRLDSRGHVLGVYEPPPAQEDLFSFFGGRQAQLFLFGGYLQLTSPEAMKDMQDALTAQEGCQMLCKLPVARVAGAFHVSVHSLSFELVRQLHPELQHLNTSHEIRTLSFGPAYPGLLNPLDGVVRMAGGNEVSRGGAFKYFLKLVPTLFRSRGGRVTRTHQYSSTEYFTVARNAADMFSPAIIIAYDFSPVSVTIEQRRRPVLHFLTRTCAVVGGVFAVCGLVDRWTHRLLSSFL